MWFGFLADPKCTNDILERRMRNALECLVPRGPDAEGFCKMIIYFWSSKVIDHRPWR